MLWLGGDVITGYESAPELQETNTLGPCQEVVFGRRHFRRGIVHLLEVLNPKRLTVPCSMGNHGRITDKLRFSTMKRTSLEHILYQVLAGDFRDDKRVQFLIPDGFATYLEVFGTTCRFMHGDTLSGGAGGAALYGGLLRAMAKQDLDRPADLTCIGHFHRYIHVQDGGRHGVVNGSVVGPSAYSTRFGGVRSRRPGRGADRQQARSRVFDSAGGAVRRKKRTVPTLVGELMAQTRQVFAATGRELSQEAVEERFVAVLDGVWDIYLRKSLCEGLGITPPPPAIEDDEDDDE